VNTDIGTVYATDAVGQLIAKGKEHARTLRDRAAAENLVRKAEAEQAAIVGASRWVHRALPCLPDTDPTPMLVNGCQGAVFSWPGLTVGLHAGANGWDAPIVYVGQVRMCCGKFMTLGESKMWWLPVDATPASEERDRLEIAAWIATSNDADPAPCLACHPELGPAPVEKPKPRRIKPSEENLLGALGRWINEEAVVAF
jgi:hypothetical protein